MGVIKGVSSLDYDFQNRALYMLNFINLSKTDVYPPFQFFKSSTYAPMKRKIMLFSTVCKLGVVQDNNQTQSCDTLSNV